MKQFIKAHVRNYLKFPKNKKDETRFKPVEDKTNDKKKIIVINNEVPVTMLIHARTGRS